MFRIIYYLSGIVVALLNGRRQDSYARWIESTRLVRRDSIVVLSLFFVIAMLTFFAWYWLIIVVASVVLLNLIVYFGLNAWNAFIRRKIVKR